jgi:lipopolysaccharide/colanic/teichoic acid biosynthesis glycosyltransferase
MALLTDIGEIHGSSYTLLKRFTDLLFGLVAGVLCLGVSAPIWVLNQLWNRGPLIYRQPRIGNGGKIFQIAKFRTMRPKELSATTPWTIPDDPRVTQFGRILRKTHLDELPQFWNILNGDLSLVGPRPEQPHYVEELRQKIPFYDVRHTVQPGLTGWAQVKYRYAATEADAFEKLQYDLFYLRHQSISLDFQVITRTIVSVFRPHGQ